MKFKPYFVFNGNTRQAVEFYQDAFGAEAPTIMTFADGPQNPEYPMPEEAKNLIMHAMLKIGSQELLFSDAFPGKEIPEECEKITLAIGDITAEEAKASYDKLMVNGTAIMELQETFWSKAYAQVKDQFGITWQISADK